MVVAPSPVSSTALFAGVDLPVPRLGLTMPREITWPSAPLSSANTLFAPMYMG